MIMISKAIEVPVEQIFRPLRHYGTQWCRVSVSSISIHLLLDWAASIPIPLKFFQGDHFLVPADMREDLLRAGATPSSW